MKKRQDSSKRERTAAVGLVVCFVAMIAIVGMITFSQYERGLEEQEQQLVEKTEDNNEETTELTQEANTDTIQAEIETPDVIEYEASVPVPELVFSSADVLTWPIDGNVIISYSMDRTVYFSTLDQYKYNPALIIAGEVGGEVQAAAVGKVKSIETTAQTGTTITMDIGSGYEVVYGQLKEVCVEKGQHVSQGECIGYVSEPTKYYNVEGPNLYFQVLKDGDPVNPLEYLEA